MTTLREAAQQALEALELGYDSAKSEADQYHAAMAGFRPERHAQMDADVQQIAAAITALRAALAQQAEPVEPRRWEGDHNVESPFNACMHKSYCITLKQALAQQAERAQDLYWRLHSLSKALEDSGRIDKHDHPDAYATILDAMALAQQAESVAEARYDGTLRWLEPHGVGLHRIQGPLFTAPPQREPLTDEENPSFG